MRMSRGLLVRLILAAGVIALLLFVALEPSPGSRRGRDIDAALESGAILALDGAETSELFETLKILANAAGIDRPVTLNAPYRPDRLNVYITTPAARAVTHCGPGNAIYDPALDAIFVDVAVLRPFSKGGLSGLLSTDQLTAPTKQLVSTYFNFVVLHEMGHRHLHRKAGTAIFDRAGISRRLEDEADDFAIKAMLKAYSTFMLSSQVVASGIYGETYSSGMSWLNSEELVAYPDETGQDRAALDLVMTVQAMTRGMFVEGYPFSPFYSDEAHATFIDRSARIIRAVEGLKKLDPAIVRRGLYMRRHLERIRQTGALPMVRIALPGAVRMADFVGDDLRIVTSVGDAFVADRGDITDALGRKPGPAAVIKARPAQRNGFADWAPWLLLSSSDRRSTLGDYAGLDEGEPAPFIKGDYLAELTPDPGPGPFTLIQASNSKIEEKAWSVPEDPDAPPDASRAWGLDGFVVWGGRKPVRRTYRELYKAVNPKGVAQERRLDLSPLNWAGGAFYFLTKDEAAADGAEVSVLRCDAALRCERRISTVQSGALLAKEPRRYDGSRTWPTENFSVAIENAQVVVYLLQDAWDGRTHLWRLWRLTAQGAPTLVVARPFLADAPPRLEATEGTGLVDDQFERETASQIDDLTSLAPGQVLVRLKNDSCYLVDTKSRTAQVLFHPCDPKLRFSVDRDGRIAVYKFDTPTIFVVQPETLAVQKGR